jgi:hypothetical protein
VVIVLDIILLSSKCNRRLIILPGFTRLADKHTGIGVVYSEGDAEDIAYCQGVCILPNLSLIINLLTHIYLKSITARTST